MTATTVTAALGLILSAPSAALAIYNFVRARDEKARLDREIGDRRAVEARANELVKSLPTGTNRLTLGQNPQEYVLGQDALFDRAVRLAHEWRAVMLR